jgi:tetratricopeptide (TPR) repeat protein
MKEFPMRHSMRSILLLALMCSAPLAARADEAGDITLLQTRWAEINYQLPEAEREKAFADLAADAGRLSATHPDSAPYLVWEGIIRSTYAGAKGGIGALGEAKKARALFERAIQIDPAAMAGSAYTSLGSLYYQVPGWPIGFGDDDTAKELLSKGLELNPDGIDSNYFYGDYLLEDGEYAQALAAFERALKAPPRPGRESADAGRRAEIAAKIAEVRRKM